MFNQQIFTKLFLPIDNSALVVFRMVFGLLLFLEAAGAIVTGWVFETFVEPSLTFTFIGFEWLQPLPGYGMYFYYAIMSFFGLMVMVGFYYRIGIAAYTVLWTITYLLQKSHYNNHYYLLILICVFMILMPAHHYYSWDVRKNPDIQSLTCPAWCKWVFILQLFIVFTYAGISKLYPDWIQGDPIRIWFNGKEHYYLIGGLLQQKWLQIMVVYGGILYDLLVIPLLLWKRTRLLTLGVSIFFHGFNSAVFQIGIFPYLMIGMIVFFFEEETIRKLFFKNKPVPDKVSAVSHLNTYQSILLWGMMFYFAVQLMLPLRFLMYPGNVHWTEEGHRLAWKMMLRVKSGYISFTAKDPETGESQLILLKDYLTPNQQRKISTRPDMIWQFAQYLKKDLQQKGWKQVEVYAKTSTSLNGRKRQPLIDPDVNLAGVEWQRFKHSPWILPLAE